jgi:hypothetical protein
MSATSTYTVPNARIVHALNIGLGDKGNLMELSRPHPSVERSETEDQLYVSIGPE